MTRDDIRSKYASGELTWGDLLVVTGLPAYELFDILRDLL